MTTFLALLEKTLATYLQAFLGLLVVGSALDASTVQVAAIAAIPAALTVVANGLPAVPGGMPFYLDLALRTARTYVAAFLGLLLAMPVFSLDGSIALAALSGAIPAALAVVKAGLAKRVGNHGTAAMLPDRLDAAA